MASYSQQLWYGKSPVHRANPKAGQSEYYYIDPRYPNATNGANEIDVPSADSPNPKATEIRNYLREFDPDAYKTVWGDEPLINIPETPRTPFDNGTGFSSVSSLDGGSVNGFAPISAMGRTQPMINTTVASGATPANNWWDTAKDVAKDVWYGVNPYNIGYNIGAGIADMQNTVTEIGNTVKNVKNIADSLHNFPVPESVNNRINQLPEPAQSIMKIHRLYKAANEMGKDKAVELYAEPSVARGWKTKGWLEPILDMNDGNKHRYVSCVSANDGLLGWIETQGGGALKEWDDFNRKRKNPEQLKKYGGYLGLAWDSLTDMGNNLFGGSVGGLTDSDTCEIFLPKEYRYKNPY